jgi:hypothetical protein
MDDVVLMAETEDELQGMLNTTKRIADKYHIVFGKEKSKILILNKKKQDHNLKLGEMELETTEKYKYLGEIINKSKNLKDQIEENRRKAEGAFQTILTIAGDPTLKNLEMEIVWKLVETCIIPIITYGGETWDLNKGENKKSNAILDNILKRILMVPTSTPRETLYTEIGLMDVEHTNMKKRINMHYRLEETKNNLITEILKIPINKSWLKTTEEIEKSMNIEYITTLTKKEAKKNTEEATNQKFTDKLKTQGESKSKVKYLLEGRHTSMNKNKIGYMNKLTRYEASTIFKARTRMLDVKNNFRGKYQNNVCRGCGDLNETQEHILEECSKIHASEEYKTKKEEIFEECPQKLREVAKKIKKTMDKLKQISVVPTQEQPGDPGIHNR